MEMSRVLVKKSTRCTLYLCCLIFHATIFAYRIEAEEQRVKNRPNRCRLVGTEGFEPPRLSPWQSQSLLPYRLAMSQYFECFGIMNIPYFAKTMKLKGFVVLSFTIIIISYQKNVCNKISPKLIVLILGTSEDTMITEFCVNCGKPLPVTGMKFCPLCGSAQPIPTKDTSKPQIQSGNSSVSEENVHLANKNQEADKPSVSNPVIPKDTDISKGEQHVVNSQLKEDKEPQETTPSYPKPSIEEANKLYQTITDETFKSCLYHLIQPTSHGLKAFYVGNEGSYKNSSFELTAQVLYHAGKIASPATKWCSFNKLPEEFEPDVLYIIGDLQSAIDNLFNLDDLSGESVATQRRYQERLDKILQIPSSYYIILDSTNVEYKGFKTLSPKVPFIFSTAISFPDLSDEEVFDEMARRLTPELKNGITPEYKDSYLDFIKRNRKLFPFNNLELANYLAGESTMKGELTIPPDGHKTESLDALFTSIIGMESVKSKLVELNEYLTARSILEKQGAVLPNFNLNMMFLGNPGVGKTTIARIIAQILFDLGYTKENKLIECTSKDLVSSYAGLTGVKTNRVISRAMGGVLFIDEAYALSNSCGQAGAEAIAILIKAMEDFKGEFVTMFAGYTNEMDDFVKSNSGIESRISYNFFFEDYSTDELLDIFKLKLSRTHMSITPDALDAARGILKFVTGKRNFGNGRFVDKMIQAVLTKHATLGFSDTELMCIRKESIPKIEEIMKIK